MARIRYKKAHKLSKPTSILHFMEFCCPEDVILKILSHAGPSAVYSLFRTSKFWKKMISSESFWRSFCQEMQKWSEDEPVPASWKAYYRQNPCVPTDYSSISRALKFVHKEDQRRITKGKKQEQQRTGAVRILLHPGDYLIRDGLTIETTNMQIVMEPLRVPSLQCRGKQTTLRLETSKRNIPLFDIVRGSLVLRNMKLEHFAVGRNIWDGNAVIHMRPTSKHVNACNTQVLPSLCLQGMEVISRSGRGIVNHRGGDLVVDNCYIHHCAATGVYIGTTTGKTVLNNSDIVYNGSGNPGCNGVEAGHCGIYIEQGDALIVDCNISHNASLGVALIGGSASKLDIRKSDLVANRFGQQVEIANRQLRESENTEFDDDNNFARAGTSRWRSQIALRAKGCVDVRPPSPARRRGRQHLEETPVNETLADEIWV